jgi:hypothetical protein
MQMSSIDGLGKVIVQLLVELVTVTALLWGSGVSSVSSTVLVKMYVIYLLLVK